MTGPSTSHDGKQSTTKMSNMLFKSIDFYSNNESDIKNAKSSIKGRVSHEGMLTKPFQKKAHETTQKETKNIDTLRQTKQTVRNLVKSDNKNN